MKQPGLFGSFSKWDAGIGQFILYNSMDTVTALQRCVVMGKSWGQTNRERRGDGARIGLDRKKDLEGRSTSPVFLDRELVHRFPREYFPSALTSSLLISADLFFTLFLSALLGMCTSMSFHCKQRGKNASAVKRRSTGWNLSLYLVCGTLTELPLSFEDNQCLFLTQKKKSDLPKGHAANAYLLPYFLANSF